jgi:hypothetical protein
MELESKFCDFYFCFHIHIWSFLYNSSLHIPPYFFSLHCSCFFIGTVDFKNFNVVCISFASSHPSPCLA